MHYFHKIYADPGNKIDHSKNKNLFCKIQTTIEEGFVCFALFKFSRGYIYIKFSGYSTKRRKRDPNRRIRGSKQPMNFQK